MQTFENMFFAKLKSHSIIVSFLPHLCKSAASGVPPSTLTGQTPLHLAVNASVVSELVKSGAMVDA